jgi:hypothetical protein
MTCKLLACSSHVNHCERLLIQQFLGHGDRRVKKSDFCRSELRVRITILVPRRTTVNRPLLTGGIPLPRMCSASHLETVQAVVYVCFACIAMTVIFTTDAVAFKWQIPGWNWALIILLSPVVRCHILVPYVLAFFLVWRNLFIPFFRFRFADHAEPVVGFLVLRCCLHVRALVWGICLPIRNFSLSSTFSTVVALCTLGHLWTWAFVTTQSRSLSHIHIIPFVPHIQLNL